MAGKEKPFPHINKPEPRMMINGVRLTEGQATTMRVALTSFDFSLDGGEDRHGKEMARLYRERIRELYKLMGS